MNELIKIYIQRWEFFGDLLLQHIMLTLTSVFFITIIGVLTGILITKSKLLAGIVLALVNFLYTIPSIALFGFLITITGIGNKSAIIALIIYGVLPIIRNTYVGLMEVDKDVIQSAVGMGSTDRQLLFKIKLPLALPIIIAGFRTMVIMTIALGGIASFVGADGLGVAIWRGISTNYSTMTLAGSLLVALLAIVADLLLGIVQRKICKRV
ncbi:ABC transporter permease [Clostridiaceae bacterium M8S5]|nr:ABC transporter permease [Clostridiaceae bacterium M8S5]